MFKEEDLVYIGYIKKPHGYSGELSFVSEDDIVPSNWIILQINQQWVPFKVEQLRSSKILSLKGVETEVKAKSLSGSGVYVEIPKAQQKPKNLNLIGFRIEDEKWANVGTIISVIPRAMQDLLEIKKGKDTILIPLAEEFIVDVNPEEKIIFTKLPEGLINLDAS